MGRGLLLIVLLAQVRLHLGLPMPNLDAAVNAAQEARAAANAAANAASNLHVPAPVHPPPPVHPVPSQPAPTVTHTTPIDPSRPVDPSVQTSAAPPHSPDPAPQPNPSPGHDAGHPPPSQEPVPPAPYQEPFMVTDWAAGHLKSAYSFLGGALTSSSKALGKLADAYVMPKTVMKDPELLKLSEYMAENNIKMDEKQVATLYESLSAKTKGGLAEVHYHRDIDDLIRYPYRNMDRIMLFKYFERELGLPELTRRKGILLHQAKQVALQRAWTGSGMELGMKLGFTQTELEQYGKVLGMGEYFPAFKMQRGMAKNQERLKALETDLPQLHKLFKDSLGEEEYKSRLVIMQAMDRTKSYDIPASLVTRWQEQGYSVPQMVDVIDLSRGHISQAENPQMYQYVTSSLPLLDGTPAEKELVNFLSVEDELAYDALKDKHVPPRTGQPGGTPHPGAPPPTGSENSSRSLTTSRGLKNGVLGRLGRLLAKLFKRLFSFGRRSNTPPTPPPS